MDPENKKEEIQNRQKRQTRGPADKAGRLEADNGTGPGISGTAAVENPASAQVNTQPTQTAAHRQKAVDRPKTTPGTQKPPQADTGAKITTQKPPLLESLPSHQQKTLKVITKQGQRIRDLQDQIIQGSKKVLQLNEQARKDRVKIETLTKTLKQAGRNPAPIGQGLHFTDREILQIRAAIIDRIDGVNHLELINDETLAVLQMVITKAEKELRRRGVGFGTYKNKPAEESEG